MARTAGSNRAAETRIFWAAAMGLLQSALPGLDVASAMVLTEAAATNSARIATAALHHMAGRDGSGDLYTMTLPTHVHLVAPAADLAFLDSQSVVLPTPLTPLQAWRVIMARPLPGLGLAFRIRDAISARFGVARIGGFTGAPVDDPKPGDRLDFFLIEHLTPEMMTLTARDSHLDVMICVTSQGARLGVTASVITHRWFGRVYMWPVAPAHRLIVWLMLRRLVHQG